MELSVQSYSLECKEASKNWYIGSFLISTIHKTYEKPVSWNLFQPMTQNLKWKDKQSPAQLY